MPHDMIQVRASTKEAVKAEKEALGISYSDMIDKLLVVWRQYNKDLSKKNGGE